MLKNFHLGRYIVGYTVENSILQPHVRGAIKRDFQTLILRYTSSNEFFEYGYPHPNALVTFSFKRTVKNSMLCLRQAGCQLHKTACQLHKTTCQPMKSDVT